MTIIPKDLILKDNYNGGTLIFKTVLLPNLRDIHSRSKQISSRALSSVVVH